MDDGGWIAIGDAGRCVGVDNSVFLGAVFVTVDAVAFVGTSIFVLIGGSGVLLGMDKVVVTFGGSTYLTFDVGGTLVAEFANVGVARLSLNGARSSEKQQQVKANINREPQPVAIARRGPPTRLLNKTQKLRNGLKEEHGYFIVSPV